MVCYLGTRSATMTVIAMSNKIPKRPKVKSCFWLESRRTEANTDKKYPEPKSFPSKPLKPYVDFAAPHLDSTFKKVAF